MKKETRGRPRFNPLLKQKPRKVTIDDDTYNIVKSFGKGNLSEGIRRMVKKFINI